MSQFVYAVGSAWGRPVKIGVASDIARRLRTLQAGNPDNLQVLWSALHHDAFALEAHLHRTFVASRVRGEWFRLDSPADIETAVQAFEGDVSRVVRAADDETRACVAAIQWMVDARAADDDISIDQAITDIARDNRLKRHLVWQFRYKPPAKAFIDQYIAIAAALWSEAGMAPFDWLKDLPRPNEIVALLDVMSVARRKRNRPTNTSPEAGADTPHKGD